MSSIIEKYKKLRRGCPINKRPKPNKMPSIKFMGNFPTTDYKSVNQIKDNNIGCVRNSLIRYVE